MTVEIKHQDTAAIASGTAVGLVDGLNSEPAMKALAHLLWFGAVTWEIQAISGQPKRGFVASEATTLALGAVVYTGAKAFRHWIRKGRQPSLLPCGNRPESFIG